MEARIKIPTMHSRSVPHRKPDLLFTTILVVALLLPLTMALQLRAMQAATNDAIEPAPVLVQVLLGEDSPVESSGDLIPMADHPDGGIQRHL